MIRKKGGRFAYSFHCFSGHMKINPKYQEETKNEYRRHNQNNGY